MKYKTSPTCQIPNLPKIYEDVFGDLKDGAFVEVGAYDGLSFSNTYGLTEIGWRGLYIEAVEEHYLQCVANHKDHPLVDVVHACVGMGQLVNIYLSGEYSSADPRFAMEAHKQWGTNYDNFRTMQSFKLQDILKDKWIGTMDLMVIDVEGSEFDVLRSVQLSCWNPRMVIIEVHEKHTNKYLSAYAPPINKYFAGLGYDKIYSDNCNNIYVRTK